MSFKTKVNRELGFAAIAVTGTFLLCSSSAFADEKPADQPTESAQSTQTSKNASKSESTSKETSKSEPTNEEKQSAPKESSQDDKQPSLPTSFYVTPDYNKSTIDEVDKIITKELYSAKLAKTVWPQALKDGRNEIVNSKNLKELSTNVGRVVGSLKSSHCQFATPNDETYHFLHALFGSFNKKLSLGKADFTGFVTGSLGYADNQIRYVLDDSPAEKAGIRIGDKIESINGNPYVGYSNFAGTSGATQKLVIERDGKKINVNLKPEKVDFYNAYVNAMKKSARVIREDDEESSVNENSDKTNPDKAKSDTADSVKTTTDTDVANKADSEKSNNSSTKSRKKKTWSIGYVHVWCGGSLSHEALDEIMEEKLSDTDGLIFDLRDGYGGNGLEDLDRFYRTEHAFPIFKTVYRDGKITNYKSYYDKPMVAIINDGSRSGKELLAFSLKRTGRAKLVGGTTAGAVLGGRLFPINDRASLYLAIFDGTIGGVRLEGAGVSPDVEVLNTEHSQAGADKQFRTAMDELMKLLNPATIQ